MTSTWLPGADLSQRYDNGGPEAVADIGVLHTTEGGGWPAYSGGGTAPNLTGWWRPGIGGVFRQHYSLETASRSLKNLAGGVQTNNNRVVQIELVGTCDPAQKGRLFYWPEADQAALDWLAGLLRLIEQHTAIPRRATARAFRPYPGSYGQRAAQRMTPAEWQGFAGWCGHQHVPENDHGDPGSLDVGYLMGADSLPPVVVLPTPTGPVIRPGEPAPAFPLQGGYYFGPREPLSNVHSVSGYFQHLANGRPGHSGLQAWQARMAWRGWSIDADGLYGPGTERTCRSFQAEKGLLVDGRIGPATFAAAWTTPTTVS